jgi:hypothetical protein
MKQHRLMEAVKHNPEFAAKVGIPQKVGEDYAAADKERDLSTLPDKVKPS